MSPSTIVSLAVTPQLVHRFNEIASTCKQYVTFISLQCIHMSSLSTFVNQTVSSKMLTLPPSGLSQQSLHDTSHNSKLSQAVCHDLDAHPLLPIPYCIYNIQLSYVLTIDIYRKRVDTSFLKVISQGSQLLGHQPPKVFFQHLLITI